MLRRLVPFSALAMAFVVAACGHNVREHRYESPGVQLILPDEIARSGAETAWDVVRRLSHMTTATGASGEPGRMYRRGRSSIVLRETPVVVVDGAQANDIAILATIRADQIAWMRVLTGAVSSTQFGAQGGAGAVIIATLRGGDSVSVARER
jgi:hypothetical protein